MKSSGAVEEGLFWLFGVVLTLTCLVVLTVPDDERYVLLFAVVTVELELVVEVFVADGANVAELVMDAVVDVGERALVLV